MSRHYEYKFASCSSSFKCTTCSKVFTRQENFKRHEQTHHKKSSGRSFQCPQCAASFLRSDLQKRHIRNCHPLTEPRSVPPLFEIPNDAQGSSFARESVCADAFFSYFQSTFPVIHEPSFDSTCSPEPLLKAITAIGGLYTEGNTGQSSTLFDSGYQALELYVKNDRTQFQDTWVISAYLMLETFGMYSCDDQLFLKAQNIHRNLVDVVRELQMTHDGQATRHTDSADGLGNEETNVEDDSIPLATRWRSFVHREIRTRTIYCLYMLDSQFATICNVRPPISALEIKYDLPCSDEIWDAQTAEDWDALRRHQFYSFNDQDDEDGFGGGRPSQGTFYESTQHLLHHGNRRMSSSLRLLWSSPFTALILVTQLQMMSRDLTHANCLFERPMGCRPPVSVLLDNQYGQIAQALRNILDLTPKGSPSQKLVTPSSHTPLWHSFWMMWYYTSITLTHPDSLLVTGTGSVESNLPAAIATAGHLARPRIKKNRDIYEDRDVFRILNGLERAIPEIDLNRLSETEHPFTTFIGFNEPMHSGI